MANAGLVDADSMAAGITLAEWFKHETKRVYGLLSETDECRDRRRLVEWLMRRGQPVTPREVQQNCRWLREPGAAEAALEELARAGEEAWETVDHNGRPGRPAKRFRLGPVYEIGTFPRENANCVDVDAVDTFENNALDRVNAELAAAGDEDEWGEI